jgi:hypothetical protein
MKKRDPSSAISATPSAAGSQGVVRTPTAPAPSYDPEDAPQAARTSWLLRRPALTALLIGLIVTPVVCLVMGLSLGDKLPLSSKSGPPAATPSSSDWSQAPVTVDERVCADFIRLKNAGSPDALALLGPPPAVPGGPVSEEQADRLETDYFLREDVRIVGGGRDPHTRALVLYAKGNVSAPALKVQTAGGVETAQRTMANPDLAVEVRDGRIYGVASSLHLGP